MKLLSIDVGIINLALCLMDDKIIKHWDVDSIASEHQDGLFETLKKHLDERDWVLECDIVIIERQPDKNKKMKTIENFIHAYFVCHDIKTILWDAKYKIPDVVGPGKKKYKLRKDTSIERCFTFIQENNPNWIDFFKSHKKKDDLADTVMQALSFKEPISKKTKIHPRKPTENQMKTRYSKANLLWLFKNNKYMNDKRFEKDLKKYFQTFLRWILFQKSITSRNYLKHRY
jgi:hypothetical protein